MKKLICLLLIGVFLFYLPNKAESHGIDASTDLSKASINDLIDIYAKRYDVSEKTLHRVIKCESGYKENAVGDGGKSFGLVQIHLPSHPEITKTQALDRVFAIEYLAKNVSKGNGKIWTCYRKKV